MENFLERLHRGPLLENFKLHHILNALLLGMKNEFATTAQFH